MVLLQVSVFVCIFGLAVSAPQKLPETFPRCQKKDPNLNECLRKAVDTSLKQLNKGLPSLGVFPIEPLKVTKLDIGNSQGGSVSLSLKFSNLLIRGLSSIRVNSLKADLKTNTFVFNASLMEPMTWEGQYEADGKVIILPIKGRGDCKLKLDNLNAELIMYGKEIKKNGVKYMDVNNMKLDFTTSRLHLHFEKLLSGTTTAVGDTLHAFLNENWREILQDLKPGIADALSQTFQEIANRVFSKVPYDQIFL